MTRAEPDTLAGTSVSPSAGSSGGRRGIFNAGLTAPDGRARPFPYLAESVPRLNTDSWRVFPGGGMETTYVLRPDLTWHDGAPLTADDFVFAWTVYATPAFGRSGSEAIGAMEEVRAPDARTLVIRWRLAYPEAAALEGSVSTGTQQGGPSFAPLPRHLLTRAYEEERESFVTIPFWTVDFVGAGPYRLTRWETGAFVEAGAFDGHALGRPKIDRVRIVWNSDASTVLANLLSGEAHLPIDESIRVSEGLVLQREWAARQGGSVRFDPQNWRRVDFQYRPELVSPRAILDERVRRAFAHAIDKHAANDGLLEGVGLAADSMFYPTEPFFAELDRQVAKYPFDPRRAEALMQEAGYRKGGDGFFESPGEGRLLFQIKGTASPQNAAERTVLAANWRSVGLDTEEGTYTPAEARDGQALASFRSTYATGSPAGIPALGLLTTGSIPRPENRWVGSNRGAWSNPDFDRLYDAVQSALDPGERAQRIIEAVRVLTGQMGVISLYFNPSVLVFPTAVKGMDVESPFTAPTWNIHAWEMA